MKFLRIIIAILLHLLLFTLGLYVVPEILANCDVDAIPYYTPMFVLWGVIFVYSLFRRVRKIVFAKSFRQDS